MSDPQGRLIVFEGVEGAGKTTQLDRLASVLGRSGVDCRTWREPGGTIAGDAIRALLLDPASSLSSRAEALLFMASRAELVERELRPALQKGAVVLLDRFFLSTYAYQVAGRGLSEEAIRATNRLATNGLVPDLTVLLTLSASEGLARAGRRGVPDRMERSGDAFHHRVEGAFAGFATERWQHGHEECGPLVTVDAAGDASAVAARVLDVVTRQFTELRSALGVVA